MLSFGKNVWNKKGSKCDVKGKDRLNAMGHVKGCVISCFAGHCTICLECMKGNGGPF